MEKINFNQVRGFSDSITLTFNFIKQREFGIRIA